MSAIHQDVIRTTKNERGQLYTSASHHELETRASLSEMAVSCLCDGFHSDAAWYAARARETKRPRFISYGSTGAPGDLFNILRDIDEEAREAIHARFDVQTAIRKAKSEQGLTVKFCRRLATPKGKLP